MLEVAKTMEIDGIEFYSRAAENASDEKVAQLLSNLASWEKNHLDHFSEIQEAIKKADSFNPDNEAMKYLDCFVKYAVFSADKDIAINVQKQDTQNVLRYAMGLEKDAICFYLGIKAMMNNSEGVKTIDDVITEEMSHITILSEQFSKI